MTNTYCDLTGEGTYALHMNESELGLIADLLNSVNDLRAVPLRRAMDPLLRANDVFNLMRTQRIKKCKYCKSTGSIKIWDDFRREWKKETCPKCNGKGRKVAIITTRFEPFSKQWADELTPEL
jgi:hypothetical protein